MTLDLIQIGVAAAISVITTLMLRRAPAPTPTPSPTPTPGPVPPIPSDHPLLSLLQQLLAQLLANLPRQSIETAAPLPVAPSVAETAPSVARQGVTFPVDFQISVRQ